MIAFAWGAWVLLAGLATVTVVRWVRTTGELIAPLPIVMATMAFYMLPRAAYLLWFDRAPLTSGGLLPNDRVGLIAAGLGLSLGGVVAFLAGHHAPSASRSATRARFSLPDPDFDRGFWVGMGMIVVGGAAMLYLYRSLGSVEYALSHQYEINVILQGKQSVFQLTRLMTIGAVLMLVDRPTRRSRWWAWLLAIAVAVALVPFGSRANILLALGLPIAAYHLTIRRLPVRWLLPSAVVGGIALLSFSYVRLLGPERVGQAVRVFARNPTAAAHFAFNAAGELKVFDAMTIVIRDVPREMAPNYGASFARVPWMIVPRRLWPEKPVTSGHMIIQRYLPNVRTAYPPTAVGEFYLAGGPFAILLGFFALGWACRFVWEWYKQHEGVGNASLYLVFCLFALDFTRVGDPSRTIWFFVIGTAFLTVAFSLASRSFTRPAATS